MCKTLWSRLESYQYSWTAILKWMRILAFFERQICQKVTKLQNPKIPYSTATWSKVEDAAFWARARVRVVTATKRSRACRRQILPFRISKQVEKASKLLYYGKIGLSPGCFLFSKPQWQTHSKFLLKNLNNAQSWNPLYYGDMGQCGRRSGAGSKVISTRELPY